MEKEHYTRAANYKPFTRLSLNSKSVFRCSNKAAGTGWGFAVAQEPSPPKLDLRLPSASSRQLRRERMFIMMQNCLSETQSQHFPALLTLCGGKCTLTEVKVAREKKGLSCFKCAPQVSHKQKNCNRFFSYCHSNDLKSDTKTFYPMIKAV